MRALFLASLLLTGCARPPVVEVTRVARVDLVESFREQAETRHRKLYLVSMPAAGRIGRLDWEPGDRVGSGQPLVSFDRLPAESEALERQAEVAQLEAEAQLAGDDSAEAAEEARARALLREAQRRLEPEGANLRQYQASAKQARLERNRSEVLFQQGAIARQQLEQARLAEERAMAQVEEVRGRIRAQQAVIQAASSEVEASQARRQRRQREREAAGLKVDQARERLQRSQHEADQVSIQAPLTGVVVERFQQGPGPLAAGEKLLSLAPPGDLEAVSDVLTQDALRLRVGTPVVLHPAPGQPALAGKVKRIEPRGFTKLSALGVEQKRVKVWIQLEHLPPELGAGYQLEAEFLLGRRPAALSLPRSALLQYPDGGFFVWKVVGGRLVEQKIQVGIADDLRVEVSAGVAEGDEIVTAPESGLKGGTEVERQAGPESGRVKEGGGREL